MSDIPYVMTKDALCPKCGTHVDCATHMSGKAVKPKPDDVSLCVGCGSIMFFNDDLSIRVATAEELEEMDQDQVKMLLILSWAMKKHRQENPLKLKGTPN